MGSALGNRRADDQRAANRAGLTFALINLEIVLKITSAIDPVDAGSIVVNSELEAFFDLLKQ